MNLQIKYILSYIVIVVVSVFLFKINYQFDIQRHMEDKTGYISEKYDVLYDKYKDIAHIIFTNDINKKEIIDIFKDAYKSDKKRKQQIRHNLLQTLKNTYYTLKKYNIKQLHFHLPNNESFLRFHRPFKFGDDLSNIRESVVYVNKNKKAIDTFEEGRVFNGYRFVFPLFNQNNHIGSVEVSFSTFAFNLEFMNSYDVETNFLVKKDIVEKKVFKEELKNYTPSILEDYYKEVESVEKLSQIYHRKFVPPNLSNKTVKTVKKGINKNITIYDHSIDKIITFIPVKNNISGSNVGLFIVKSSAKYVDSLAKNLYGDIFLFNLLVLIIFIFVYKNHQKQVTLKTIIDEADSGIGVISMDGDFKKVNHVYCELLGYSENELLEQNCSNLTLKEDKEKINTFFSEARKKGYISKMHKRCINKNGDIVHLEFSLKVLPSNNEFVVVINSLEDKIELERLNNDLQKEIDITIEQLRQKDQMLFSQSKLAALGEMIDAIAHQCRSPLSIIKIYSEMIEMLFEYEKVDKNEVMEYTQKQLTQVNHLNNTIEEFRSFFRPDTKIEDIPVKKVIDSVNTLMKDEFVKNKITLNIKGDTTLVFKMIPNEFKHVLINLFNNAKDAFNEKNIEKRTIELEVKENILTISDNAGGIPENIIDNIFEANFTTKSSDKGTGIGLYITKQILEKVGAKIDVENIQNGARFTIYFQQ